jgi:hypothetical protein
MKTMFRTGFILILALTSAGLPRSVAADLRDALQPAQIDFVRIRLNASGVGLGFETDVAGTDARLTALLEVVRQADTRGGHKCPNVGSIRFHLRDGNVIGIGLLPSHSQGVYELRLYDGENLITAYRVRRAKLLAALELLGVPIDDPAFRE